MATCGSKTAAMAQTLAGLRRLLMKAAAMAALPGSAEVVRMSSITSVGRATDEVVPAAAAEPTTSAMLISQIDARLGSFGFAQGFEELFVWPSSCPVYPQVGGLSWRKRVENSKLDTWWL